MVVDKWWRRQLTVVVILEAGGNQWTVVMMQDLKEIKNWVSLLLLVTVLFGQKTWLPITTHSKRNYKRFWLIKFHIKGDSMSLYYGFKYILNIKDQFIPYKSMGNVFLLPLPFHSTTSAPQHFPSLFTV